MPEKTPALVETELRRESDDQVAITVRSAARRGPRSSTTTGRAGCSRDGRRPARLAAIERRCTLRRESFGPGEQQLPQERLLAFGTRWKAVRSIAFGKAEALARLELLPGHSGDLPTYGLHPGLLDMATGCAFALVDGPGSESLVVPMSYGRVRVAKPLPSTLMSHVRLRPESSGGVACWMRH